MRNSPKSGMGFFGILTLILIVLKVAELISLSWFWVIAPLLVPFLVFMIVFSVFFIYYGIRRSSSRRSAVVIEEGDEFDTLIKESELPNDRK